MSFRTNGTTSPIQTSMLDVTSLLSDREKRFLDNSWAKVFAEEIFPQIDEKAFAPLYSQVDSRPNTPVNVTIGALLLKELNNMSDEDVLNALMFDIRFKVALHTTDMSEQPMSDRTLGRFRARCEAYRLETGTDLLHDCIKDLSEKLATVMKVDRSLRRMDSMMIHSNIQHLTRLQLLYKCTSKMVQLLHKEGKELPAELQHYLNKEDENLVIYYNKSEDTSSKIEKILKDICILVALCAGGQYDGVKEYQLLQRMINEQTVKQEDGSYELKQAGDPSMNSGMMQNPTDPDATYREKNGQENRGYVANLVEEKGENGSMVTDYQLEQNTYSDSQFMSDYVENVGPQEKQVTIVADGAFSGSKVEEKAAENNVAIENTNLTGREAKDIAADFVFNEDGTRVTACPNGQEPKSCSCSKAGVCTVSFRKECCENCPYRDQCQPKEYAKTMRVTISAKAQKRALKQRHRKTDEFKKLSAFRNGVETVPSFLRRHFHVDTMPVRGKMRVSFFFGCKVGGLNVRKFCNFWLRRNQSAQMAVVE